MDSFRKLLYRFYWKAESAIVPGLTSSQYCYYNKLRSLVPGKVWLDLGCGHQVFAQWMDKEQAEVLASSAIVYGLDLDWEALKAHKGISHKVFGDLLGLPFKNDSIEVVSANMVAEHLSSPDRVLREIHRVLKPNGAFIFHTPNYWNWAIQLASRVPDGLKRKLIWFFERRREQDVFPTHYRMNTEAKIRQLAADTNFAVEDVTMVSTSALTFMLGPLVVGELLYIRYLQRESGAKFRSNVVAILRKPP